MMAKCMRPGATSCGKLKVHHPAREATHLESLGLSDFETPDECNKRQKAMLSRFEKHGFGANELGPLTSCTGSRLCQDWDYASGACYNACRKLRYHYIRHLHPILKESTVPLWLATVVNGRWQQQFGGLKHCKPKSLHRWLTRRLKGLSGEPAVKGIIGVEASVNITGDDMLWQPHIHAVLSCPSREELKKVLAIEASASVPKPVMIKAVPLDDLASVIGYTMKRLPEARVLYLGENGRAQQRHVRPTSAAFHEYDVWLLKQKISERFQLVGMRMNNGVII